MARIKRGSGVVEAAIAAIMNGDEVVPPLIIGAPRSTTMRLDGSHRNNQVVVRRPTQIENVRDQIIRIQNDANPIQFLVDVQNGAMFEVINLEPELDENKKPTGRVIEHKSYQQAKIQTRVDVARYLANKVLPSLSIQKHVFDQDGANDEETEIGQKGNRGASFAAIVSAAASRAAASIEHRAPRPVKVVDPGDEAEDAEFEEVKKVNE